CILIWRKPSRKRSFVWQPSANDRWPMRKHWAGQGMTSGTPIVSILAKARWIYSAEPEPAWPIVPAATCAWPAAFAPFLRSGRQEQRLAWAWMGQLLMIVGIC